MSLNNIKLKEVEAPKKDWSGESITLTNETITYRVSKVLDAMKMHKFKQLIIYADVEHGGNFEYLVGFFPRFEEALLIVDDSGEMRLLLGNENLNKSTKSRVKSKGIHVSQFSLPNQPQRNDYSFNEIIVNSGICTEGKIGIVGWKNFTSRLDNNPSMFDIPSFIVDTLRSINNNLENATHLFIGENGVRRINNANEIAYFEFGASLASDAILDAMNAIEVGVSELEGADCLTRYGQHSNVITIMASGERFVQGNMYPTSKKIKAGEQVSMTIGYRGGLSSRGGYVVENKDQLPENQRDYIERVAAPYFNAYSQWLENIQVGMTGADLYNTIEKILPKEKYGWTLCPGHLVSYEEWSSSPIYENSKEIVQSGMIFQVDIIPSVEGYSGVSAESTVLIADNLLKKEIEEQYPDMWLRMQNRLDYLKNTLGIKVSDNILPMCSTVGYLRPFLLNKKTAFIKESVNDK